MNEEKVKIKISIAGESFLLAVPYSKQEETRRTEENVNAFFDAWRSRFPEKNDRELLAMIAFRYADQYSALIKEREATLRTLEEMGGNLESILGEQAD